MNLSMVQGVTGLGTAFTGFKETVAHNLSTFISSVNLRVKCMFELFRKTIVQYLNEENMVEAQRPRVIFYQALKFGFLQSGRSCLRMIDNCNLTSHIYGQITVDEIFTPIVYACFDERGVCDHSPL